MLKVRGFTLIEIMIAVAIIAILAAVGYPNYADYVRRGRITEAVSALSNGRVQMEQWFQDNRNYNGAGNPCAAIASTPTFDFTCVPAATTYTITATGKGSMAGFQYTIDQSNRRNTSLLPSGWQAPSPNNCWALKKDGSC